MPPPMQLIEQCNSCSEVTVACCPRCTLPTCPRCKCIACDPPEPPRPSTEEFDHDSNAAA